MLHPKIYKVGDLVRLDPNKYNKPTSEMVGVISKISSDSEGWRWSLISVSWAGEREDTSHLPNDLESAKQ